MNVDSNIDDVIARLRQKAARVRDLSVPVAAAGVAVRSSIVERFTGANGWAPNSPYTVAQKGSSQPGIDTGTLRNSITSTANGNTAIVGTNVRYAKWFNDGTGIFRGASAWEIHPRSGKALAFKGPNGEMFFARAVTIQGQPARPFIMIDDQVRGHVHEIFRRWVLSLGSVE